jgi:hypothetical protein
VCTCGIGSQCGVSEAFIEGDALRVFHCLVAIICDEEGNAIDDIEVEFLSAPKKFISAHPRAACDYLRDLIFAQSRALRCYCAIQTGEAHMRESSQEKPRMTCSFKKGVGKCQATPVEIKHPTCF